MTDNYGPHGRGAFPTPQPPNPNQPPAYLLDTVLYALRRAPEGATCHTLAGGLGEPVLAVANALEYLRQFGQVDRRQSGQHVSWFLRPGVGHG